MSASQPSPASGGGRPKVRPSDDEAIAATAAAWLAQRDDELSPAAARDFAAWRAADPRHEAAVQRLERTWSTLQQLRDFRPAAVRHPDRDLLRARARVRPVPRWPAWAAAAAVIVAGFVWWGRVPSGAAAVQVFATAAEGYERVPLSDGSVLELNGGTEVQVDFSGPNRHVRLRRGEAHFSVAKDAGRPFLVDAGGVSVRALGTAFNVRRGVREVEVLVTEGRVAVVPAAGGPADTGAPLQLVANERTVIATAGAAAPAAAPVERVAPGRIREALAWQGPRLVFADTPLAEAAAQFNRHNAVRIELADPELGALPIGGSFRAEHAEAFLRLLESGGEIAVERPAPDVVRLRRRPPAPAAP